ncbi:MAG: hypothetical protein IVW36_05975 [Dehalococcoidia bacterium]|nr:hypothetical protein [Dehalococcoidia bacterium]
MADTSGSIESYAARFRELRAQLVPILGATTVDLIIERAAVEIDGVYPEMKLLRIADHAIDLEAFEVAMEGKTDAQIRAAFDALSGVVMLILARLLGKEVATRLVHNGGTRGGQPRGAG